MFRLNGHAPRDPSVISIAYTDIYLCTWLNGLMYKFRLTAAYVGLYINKEMKL